MTNLRVKVLDGAKRSYTSEALSRAVDQINKGEIPVVDRTDGSEEVMIPVSKIIGMASNAEVVDGCLFVTLTGFEFAACGYGHVVDGVVQDDYSIASVDLVRSKK